jgi:hypothetical protein
MHLKNSFPDWSWSTFMDVWACWYCGKNSADCLHHIVGRGGPQYDCENSLFNAAPMCNFQCHLAHHGLITTDEYKSKFLQKTFDKLINNLNHEIGAKDWRFIQKYKKYYRPDQLSFAAESVGEPNIFNDALDVKTKSKRSVPRVHDAVQKKAKLSRKRLSVESDIHNRMEEKAT